METRKTQVAKAINFIYSKDINDKQVMHSMSDNIEIMSYDKADKVIKELFESILCRYQIGRETLKKETLMIFDSVHLLYYKCD